MRLTSLVFLLPLLVEPAFSLQRGFLYPHGRGWPDKILPPQDDVSSPELFLRTDIVFYDQIYKSVFVNSNGLLSFLTEVSRFYNLQFPLDYPVIAPLYSNVDVRASGSVFYRETQDEIILERATRTVQNAFSTARDFQATSVLIVTWEDVGYHKQGADKVNTFQTVVISDGSDSYVELLYPDNGIQWVQGLGEGGSLPDAIAQAGFISEDGRIYILKGSGTDQVRNLNEWSNADNPGQWLFHVGKLGSDGNVEQPDIIQEEEDSSAAFCSSGFRTCHSRATCADFESGFCCVCQSGFFGNGKNCLSEVLHIRVNGKVSGNVNGVDLPDLDLQAYVVPADGRTYTAISVIPQSISYDMQTLNVLGTSIGWLFARPVKGALNGYQLTGGVFNQTVTVRFPHSGHQLTLTQRFTGLDVFQQLTMTGNLRGTVPAIPIGSKIIIRDYEEQFTRVGLGQLIAKSSQVYRLDGVEIDNPFTVEQIINFDECAGTVPTASTMRMKVMRTTVIFEENEAIVRYSMTNKVTPLGMDEDPCRDAVARCGPHSTCVVEGDSFRCACNPGYQLGYVEENGNTSCIDIDECANGLSDCDSEATCTNTQGSFFCQCNPGYTNQNGNCIKILTCEDTRCDPNADCVQRPRSAPHCICRSGFQGNGTYCNYIDSQTDHRDRDEPPPPPQRRDEIVQTQCTVVGCECPEGYDIDETETWCYFRKEEEHQGREYDSSEGLCVLEGLRCHRDASCVIYANNQTVACECNDGLSGDGQRYCEPSDGYSQASYDECSTASDCIGDADCVTDLRTRRLVCECHPGFTKNPVTNTCHRESVEDNRPPTCQEANICHPDARCVRDERTGQPVCSCNPGLEGDGISCRRIETGCNVLDNCARGSADCQYDLQAQGYRCKCRQGYEGDGHECTLTRTCREDPSMCGEHAACQPDHYRGYACQCENGFEGNGQLCKPLSARIGNFLLIGQGMAILRVPFQPTSTDRGRPVVMQPYQQAIGVDVDCSENRVYWSDITGGNIFSSDYAGHDIETFIGSDIGSAEGLSIDWLSRNIFWTDSARDTVEVASLDDSSLRKIIVSSGLVNPRGIAVHPARGKVFWADWNREAPKIEWSNMDGSGRSVFVQGPRVKLPNSLALDYSTDELCWADAGTFSIECIGIGNHYERTVASNLSYPFGLTLSQDHYYWTDWVSQKIERATRPGQVPEKPLLPPLGSSGKLYGITAVSDSCPRLSNICQQDRGRCPQHHLCLLNGNSGRSCVCASPICANLNN